MCKNGSSFELLKVADDVYSHGKEVSLTHDWTGACLSYRSGFRAGGFIVY